MAEREQYVVLPVDATWTTYQSEEVAIEVARDRMVQRYPRTYVVYKAVAIVEPELPPIRVVRVNSERSDG